MTTIFKKFSLPISAIALAACGLQGPWDYWPEDAEEYRGIYTIAYVVADRSVSSVCFERILDLDEEFADEFAFYDSASVSVSGSFRGIDSTIVLFPKKNAPNCFEGPEDIVAIRGKTYELNAYFIWDSSGYSTKSHYKATAAIPSGFSIRHVYAPTESGLYAEIASGDTVRTLDAPNDLKSYKFETSYNDSVKSVFYSIHYNPESGENVNNSMNKMMSHFVDDPFLIYSPFDSIYWGALYENFSFGAMNALDTIYVSSYEIPVLDNKILFYATDVNYSDFMTRTLESAEDSRIHAVTNVEGGAGFFSGMSVDTFRLYMDYSNDDDILLYKTNAVKTCRDTSWSTKACRSYLDEFCKDSSYVAEDCYSPAVFASLEAGNTWDDLLPGAIDTLEKQEAKRNGELRFCIANNFSGDAVDCTENFAACQKSEDDNECKELLWTYCGDGGWNLSENPQCGTALVSRYRIQKLKSPVIKKIINQWCEENKNDPQCAY